jgi:excinuclease ABC subunit C
LRQLYQQQIKRIVAMLEGKSQKIMKDLAKERDLLTRSENFEKAQEVQRQLQALAYVTQPFRQGFEYDTNPNLRSDTRSEEVSILQKVLQAHGMQVSLPEKIECYDISNIQGTNAVGSMVVFIEGEKESALYRKYKIRRENTPNDFAMMEEVLTRRLKHTEWKYPDLLVVDGGKGQITSALKALASHNLQIPLIGLAKREETIIIPKGISEDHFEEVSLSKNSPALQLLMRIRDEAHRFAITYHRKLRSKKMTGSTTSS